MINWLIENDVCFVEAETPFTHYKICSDLSKENLEDVEDCYIGLDVNDNVKCIVPKDVSRKELFCFVQNIGPLLWENYSCRRNCSKDMLEGIFLTAKHFGMKSPENIEYLSVKLLGDNIDPDDMYEVKSKFTEDRG